MSWQNIASEEFCSRLCLTLLHSLWQGAALAAAAWLSDRLMPRHMSRRHAVHVVGLLACVFAAGATFVMVEPPVREVPATAATDGVERVVVVDGRQAPGAGGMQNFETAAAPPPDTTASGAPRSAAEPRGQNMGAPTLVAASSDRFAWLPIYAPWLAAAYAVGVAAMAFRLLRGIVAVQRLAGRGQPLASPEVGNMIAELARRCRVRPPRVLTLVETAIPRVVGLARPILLLPATAVTGLAPDELEMIVAHELAHIRRYDLWINLLQRVAETVLFFNPAVWMISRRISSLREFCCDELACRLAAGPVDLRARYARALVRVVELQRTRAGVGDRDGALAGLAANGRSPSELRRRVERLFGEPAAEPLRITRAGAFCIAAALVAACLAPTWRRLAADEPKATANRLSFPPSAVGMLYVRPQTAGGFGLDDDVYSGWKPLGPAQSNVTIPAKSQVRLDIAQSAADDLSFIAELPADSIAYLNLEGTGVEDAELRHVGRLTGLRMLSLEQARITDSGIQKIGELAKLEQISLSAYDVHKDGFGVGDEGLAVLAKLPELKFLDLRLTKVTDAGLAHLARHKALEYVGVEGTKVTDAGLESLASLPKLEWLSLGVYDEGADVTDAGMATIARMTQLRGLNLCGTKVGDAGLTALAPLRRLESLSIDNTQATNAGLSALAPLESLKRFRAYGLSDGAIKDEGARHLAKATALEQISANMELSDQGVTELAKLPQLRSLSLSGEKITDACCEVIAEMSRLETLWFQDCLITDAGLETLANAPRIEYLLIHDAPITSEGLRHLKGWSRLKRLSLEMDVDVDRSPDTAPSLARIGELENLESLDANGFDGREVAQLASLKRLTELELGERVIVDDDIARVIESLESLTNLEIRGSTISDEGLKRLASLKRLEHLNISCLATDAGLHSLAKLDSLQLLQVASPYVTEAGLQSLGKALPSLREVEQYDYRLHGSSVTIRQGDPIWREGEAEKRAARDALEGESAPKIIADRWINVEGEPPTWESLRGKVVLVDFWGAWCGPCRAAMPELKQLHARFADRGLVVLGVHTTTDAEKADAFVREAEIDWPVAIDKAKATTGAWKVDSYPDYYLVDRDGRVRYADVFTEHMEGAIESLLEEGPGGDDARVKASDRPSKAVAPTEEKSKQKSPFYVYGRVTDDTGEPMEGVVVRAATGVGTLLGRAEVKTDAKGRYRLHFRGGLTMMSDDAPLGIGMQAAVITARKPGYYELNLNRQGGLLMSDLPPEQVAEAARSWGERSPDKVVLPDKPIKVSFKLARAATIEGRLVANGSRSLEKQKISLVGEELPPASSVFSQVETGEDGRFRIENVPLNKQWRFAVRVQPTWEDLETDPITLSDPGVHRCELSIDSQQKDGGVTLKLRYRQQGDEPPRR